MTAPARHPRAWTSSTLSTALLQLESAAEEVRRLPRRRGVSGQLEQVSAIGRILHAAELIERALKQLEGDDHG